MSSLAATSWLAGRHLTKHNPRQATVSETYQSRTETAPKGPGQWTAARGSADGNLRLTDEASFVDKLNRGST